MHTTGIVGLTLALAGLTACSGSAVTPPGKLDASSSFGDGGVKDPERFDWGFRTDLGAAPAADRSPLVKSDAAQPYGTCTTPCSGKAQVLHNSKYNKWIKLVLCSPSRYDIFMGEAQSGPFYKVGDTAGGGEDHCELVNPSFTMTNSDGIRSGNCPTCWLQGAGSVSGIPWLWGTPMYWRDYLGEPFNFGPANHQGIHTACWYECGVTF